MENTLQTLNPILSIGIVLSGIALTVGTFILIFKQGASKTIVASDGTRFNSEDACSKYEASLERLKPLYDSNDGNMDKTYGFKEGFLETLKNGGFKDVKTLIKYRAEFEKLEEFFETKSLDKD